MKNKLAIAVDLGASNVRVALVSTNGKLVDKKTESTDKHGKAGATITNQIAGLIAQITKSASLKSFAGIGIASIGPLDYKKGGPIHSPNIPYSFVPLVKPLEKKFSLHVSLLNDTNAAVLGERLFGVGKNIDNLVYVTISTGIGGGAIVNGNLLLGKGGNAAEVGHLSVDTKYDMLCSCKKGTDHWEGLASGTNIPKFFATWAKSKNARVESFKTTKEIFQEARNKNEVILQFLDALAKVNARAISDIIVAYDPQLITLGGSVVLNNKDIIISGIKKYVDHFLPLPRIQVTPLGDDIVLLGAGTAVFQKKMGRS